MYCQLPYQTPLRKQIDVQYSPDNLTLTNSHAPLNLHACTGFPCYLALGFYMGNDLNF